MADTIVVCAQPSRLPRLRRDRGFAEAWEAVTWLHERFRAAVGDSARGCAVEERIYSVFPSDEVAKVAEAVAALVFEMPEERTPIAVGCSLDSDDVNVEPWIPEVRSAAAAKARSLSAIAGDNRVLVDGAFRDAARSGDAHVIFPPVLVAVDGDGRPRGVTRELAGLPDPIELAVLCDPRGEPVHPQTVTNFPVLRPQLKSLEDKTAQLLMQVKHLENAITQYSQTQTPAPGPTRAVRSNGETTLRYAYEALELVEQCSELRIEPEIVDLANVFRNVTERLRKCLKDETIVAHQLNAIWDAFGPALEDLHRHADRLIKEGDGTIDEAARRS